MVVRIEKRTSGGQGKQNERVAAASKVGASERLEVRTRVEKEDYTEMF